MERGFILKWQRARGHINDFIAKSDEWFARDAYEVFDEPDPEGEFSRRVRVVVKKQLPRDPFSLLIGDIVYNMRSALDNLAFELNGGMGAAAKLKNESEFPIFGNEDRSGARMDGRIRFRAASRKYAGMSKKAVEVIEGLQPYHRGDSYRADHLWQLNWLCNADKHRMLHAIAASFGGMALHVDSLVNYAGMAKYWSSSVALDKETVVARYSVIPQDPKKDARVRLEFVPGIGLADGPLKDHNMIYNLPEILQYLEQSVFDPLLRFL